MLFCEMWSTEGYTASAQKIHLNLFKQFHLYDIEQNPLNFAVVVGTNTGGFALSSQSLIKLTQRIT